MSKQTTHATVLHIAWRQQCIVKHCIVHHKAGLQTARRLRISVRYAGTTVLDHTIRLIVIISRACSGHKLRRHRLRLCVGDA